MLIQYRRVDDVWLVLWLCRHWLRPLAGILAMGAFDNICLATHRVACHHPVAPDHLQVLLESMRWARNQSEMDQKRKPKFCECCGLQGLQGLGLW